MVENIILRTVYKKAFFNILLHRVHILLQSFQKVTIGPQKIFLKKIKKSIKTKNLKLSTKLLKKLKKSL